LREDTDKERTLRLILADLDLSSAQYSELATLGPLRTTLADVPVIRRTTAQLGKWSRITRMFPFSSVQLYDHMSMIKKVVKLRRAVGHLFKKGSDGSPQYLVRVDDFPSLGTRSEIFLRFHEILQGSGIPYILGVTPYLCNRELSKSEEEILYRLIGADVEIAMHGITHQTESCCVLSELIGLNRKTLEDKFSMGFRILENLGLDPQFFIPPFNAFELDCIPVLREYFVGICGGPESVNIVGYRISPSFLADVLYVPSYFPAYGKSYMIMQFVRETLKLSEAIIIPITIHWASEIDDNFARVRLLCRFLKGHVQRWSDLVVRSRNA